MAKVSKRYNDGVMKGGVAMVEIGIAVKLLLQSRDETVF